MIIRSRAPLRLGLAGGGTDLASYYKNFGGAVFNACIGMYAYCSIIPTDDGMIEFIAYDNQNNERLKSEPKLEIHENVLILQLFLFLSKILFGGICLFINEMING